MKTSEEQDLLNQARAFDSSALAAIYDRFSPGLYAYAMRLLGDQCLAEDCVAETFSRFLKALQSGQGPDAHLQAYLYRVAHNWITDLYRRQPPPPLELDEDLRAEEEAQPEHQVDHSLARQEVRNALRMLTPEQRQVVVLRFLEDWENEEVSAALHRPVSAVKSLQHRALNTLRRWLMGKHEEEGMVVNEYGK